MTRLLLLGILLAPVAGVTAGPPAEEKIEVKVLAILVSKHHTKVDDKLAQFAEQVQKQDPSRTGFKLERSNARSVKLGETQPFDLCGKQVVEVTVNKERNENGRITLTVKPPKLTPITYECACGKYFSMATQHFEGKGKDRAQLFIAIMARPCGASKK